MSDVKNALQSAGFQSSQSNFIRLQFREIKCLINFMKEMGRDENGKSHLTDEEVSVLRKLEAIKALQESKAAMPRRTPPRRRGEVTQEEIEKAFTDEITES